MSSASVTTTVTSAAGPAAGATLSLRVEEIAEVASDVRAITLVAPDGAELPAWEPGAHVDVVVDDAQVRQYSLCSNPEDRSCWRIGVLREDEGRGGSRYLHTALCVGQRVAVSPPRNNFALRPAERYLFIAGGIGITPILPMAEAARRAGADYRVVYTGRLRTAMAFLDELAVHEERLQVWTSEEQGRIDLAELLARTTDDTHVYCCGPATLLEAVEEQGARLRAGNVHVERFEPKEYDVPEEGESSFEVEFAESGVTATVGPGESILQVAQNAGIDVFFSCQEGTCGSCETPILEGEAEHRDSVLGPAEQEENTCMMICVSRARTPRLVLEL